MSPIHRFILTGMPGCGKTSLIHALATRGETVLHEAATDVITRQQRRGIARPWERSGFIDSIARLQRQRLQRARTDQRLQFYDRSPLCTYALALYLKMQPPAQLLQQIATASYEKTVFFVENLGTIAKTAARQISFQDALVFETLHREVYAQFGYRCVCVPVAPPADRAQFVLAHVENLVGTSAARA